MEPRPSRRPWAFVLTVAAYGIAAFASLAFRMPGTNISLVWLATGVAVVAMWLGGAWLWTAVAATQFTVALLEGNGAFNIARVVAANTVTPLLVILLLRRFRCESALARFRDAVGLLAAAAAGGLAGALLNALLRLVERGVQGDELQRLLNWWLGDVTGLLVIAPVALTWSARSEAPGAARRSESVAVAMLLAAMPVLTLVAFPHGPAVLVSVLYLAVPVQMWAAARFGPRGGAQAFGVVAGGVLLASVTTLRAEGVDPRTALVLLDGFLIVSGAAGLIVAALVAENARAATALADAKRLEMVRRLAGGLAHDFHNLLTVILGHVDLLRIDRAPRDVEEDLEAIRDAAARAATITQQLLAYGQRTLLRPTLFDVNALVRDSADPVTSLLAPETALRLELGDALLNVRTDRDQLERVLIQLCVRAGGAMGLGGTLTIATAPSRLPDGSAAVSIQVADTGVPLTSSAPGGALEPYAAGPLATGDGTHRPSGLELAMADGFVRQVGGTITVRSASGSGTSVTLVLPAAPPEA